MRGETFGKKGVCRVCLGEPHIAGSPGVPPTGPWLESQAARRPNSKTVMYCERFLPRAQPTELRAQTWGSLSAPMYLAFTVSDTASCLSPMGALLEIPPSDIRFFVIL